jgi:hypothetical protein
MAWVTTAANADVKIMDRGTADVAVVPKRKKVAIIGFATNTLHLVPWQDPEFELWGMNQGAGNFQRKADRWFEMHLPEYTADVRDPQYLDFLKNAGLPIYMIEAYDEYPCSVRYPIESALQYAGRDYFMSSVSFMLCLAAIEGFQEVHLYGINLAIGDEYFYEKPNAEWWIGLLTGRGMKIVVPNASSLLKQQHRYGYSAEARPNAMTKALLTNRMQSYRAQCEQKLNEYHIMLGAMRECDALVQVAEGLDRGADIVLMPQIAPPPASTSS